MLQICERKRCLPCQYIHVRGDLGWHCSGQLLEDAGEVQEQECIRFWLLSITKIVLQGIDACLWERVLPVPDCYSHNTASMQKEDTKICLERINTTNLILAQVVPVAGVQ